MLGYEVNQDKNRLLFWREDGISIIDFRPRNLGFDIDPQQDWVLSGARNVIQAFWVNKGSHVIFLEGGKVSLLELDRKGKNRMDHVVKTKIGSKIFYSQKNSSLYCLDTKGSLLKMVIVNQR